MCKWFSNTEGVFVRDVVTLQWEDAMTMTTYQNLTVWTDPKNTARSNDEC